MEYRDRLTIQSHNYRPTPTLGGWFAAACLSALRPMIDLVAALFGCGLVDDESLKGQKRSRGAPPDWCAV